MKKLAFVAAALAFTAGSVQAADLGRMPRKAQEPGYVAAPPLLWNGFYIGAHVGYGWGDTSTRFLGATILPAPRPEGVFGGGQLGYNFQVSPNWVIGIEADVSGGDIRDSVIIGGFTGRARTDVFGTVRGRIGYAFNNVLLYGTGGFAWANNRLSITPAPAGVDSISRVHTGWTAGGGIEYAFSPNWSAKAEYLYIDLGRENYNFGLGAPLQFRNDMHTVKLGVNYRFNWGGPVVAKY